MNTQTTVERDCVFEHQGRKFESGGAFVSPDFLIAYPGANGVLNDWHGRQIGTYQVISSRPAVFFGHRSFMADRYFYMRAKLTSGETYSLRGFGEGMIARGKRTN